MFHNEWDSWTFERKLWSVDELHERMVAARGVIFSILILYKISHFNKINNINYINFNFKVGSNFFP